MNISFRKFKKIFSRTVFQAIITSFLTSVITLSIAGFFIFHYKVNVAKILGFTQPAQIITPILPIPSIPALDKESVSTVAALPVEKQNTVIDVVKSANPAVVSIVISKEVPKYTVSYETVPNTNPFTDIFGNVFPGFQNPVYKQDGTEKKEIGSGSGFLISSDGYIVTNRHVVQDKDAIYTVTLNNSKKYVAKVLARDGVLDVAIIKIDPAIKLPYLSLGDSDTIEVGQSVVAIGNALGQFKNSVSVGVVSGLSRSLVAGDGMGNSEQLSKVIQTDAAINPGNSGGPLLDMEAKVIGVNVAVVQGSENIGFALPINSIKSVISSVKKTGKITRPYVGIRYIVITPELKTKNNLTVDYGIIVARGKEASELAVIAGSPADVAGIMESDIILSVDSQKIDKDNDFSNIIRGKKIGDTVVLRVLSKGIERNVILKLKQAPEN